MNQHGINPTPECPLLSEFVSDFTAIERTLLLSAHTVLFIAVDARAVSSDTVAKVAERLSESGLIWGPDCERVHDIFDEVHVGDGSIEPSFTLMSTWQSDEPLEEAVWFFTQSAFPLDDELATTSYLAITVGRTDLAATVEHVLSDLAALKTRMLDDEPNSNGTT